MRLLSYETNLCSEGLCWLRGAAGRRLHLGQGGPEFRSVAAPLPCISPMLHPSYAVTLGYLAGGREVKIE